MKILTSSNALASKSKHPESWGSDKAREDKDYASTGNHSCLSGVLLNPLASFLQSRTELLTTEFIEGDAGAGEDGG